MEAAGVDAGVVVGRLAGVLGSVPNEDVRQIVAAHPGRFIGAASIDPTDRRRPAGPSTRRWRTASS